LFHYSIVPMVVPNYFIFKFASQTFLKYIRSI